MRIIAGKYKGRKIDFPRHIRPTQEKVRQAIFDTLAQVTPGARVLELFAGSGALGLEAASRGAAGVCFIDSDSASQRVIRDNIEKLGLEKEGVEVENYLQDACRAIGILSKRGRQFDLVFLDPPYEGDDLKKTLKTIIESDILTPHSFVVVEYSRQNDPSEASHGLELVRRARYGNTLVDIYSRQGHGAPPETA